MKSPTANRVSVNDARYFDFSQVPGQEPVETKPAKKTSAKAASKSTAKAGSKPPAKKAAKKR